MGLFKSQKSVNEGLFEATYEQYRQKSFDLPLSGADLCIYHYWLWYSKSLANNLLNGDKSLMKAWGKGSPEKAAAMCEVCVQPIISMWYGNTDVQSSGVIGTKKEMHRVDRGVSPAVNDVAEYPEYYVFDDPQVQNSFDNIHNYAQDVKKTMKGHSSEFPTVTVFSEREKAIKLAISNMLHLFGTDTDIRVQHFLSLDLQYVYDEKIREQKRISLYYIDLFLSKLAEALGYQNYIDWGKQTFPVKFDSDFRFTNPNNHYLDFGYEFKSRMSMTGLIYIGGAVTFDTFKFMNQLDALGHSEEAPNNYNRLLEKTSNNSAALDNHGNTFGGAENHDEELIRYDRSLKLHPDDLDTLNNRGDTLYELGRYEEALNDYNRSLELQPDDSEVLACRGDVLYELERFEEALRDYNRSLEISSDDTLTLEGRGDTLSALGRYEEALNDYNRLLELEPDNSGVLKSRSVVLRKLKQHS